MGECELTFEDNFDGTEVDANKWQYRTDSKHWSTQLPENVEVKDGYLYLNVRKQTANGMDYTGSGVITKQRFKFGYYESRFKVPAGDGWHSSFWLMGYDGSGGTSTTKANQEIDICENDSKNFLMYGTNVHNWLGSHTSVSGVKVTTPDLRANFHTWGCDFSPNFVKFYFEGNLVRTVDVSKQALNDNNIWLTTIGSYLGNTTAIDDSKLPSAAIFDYVRYYKQLNPVLNDTVGMNLNPENVLTNGDFEVWTDKTTLPESWTRGAGTYGVNYFYAFDTDTDQSNVLQLKDTVVTSVGAKRFNTSGYVSVPSAGIFRVSFKVKGNVGLRAVVLTKGTASPSTNTPSATNHIALVPDYPSGTQEDEWKTVEYYITVPETATFGNDYKLHISWSSSASSKPICSFYIDDISLQSNIKTGISKLEASKELVIVKNGKIVFAKVENSPFTVYDVNGHTVREGIAETGHSIPLSRGVYIVRVQDRVQKLIL